MNLEKLHKKILELKSEADDYRIKADFLEDKIVTFKEAIDLLNEQGVIDNIPKMTQSSINIATISSDGFSKVKKLSCKGITRKIFEFLKESEKPLKPHEIYKPLNIHKGSTSALLLNAVDRNLVIRDKEQGVYSLSSEGKKLLEMTKDDDPIINNSNDDRKLISLVS